MGDRFPMFGEWPCIIGLWTIKDPPTRCRREDKEEHGIPMPKAGMILTSIMSRSGQVGHFEVRRSLSKVPPLPRSALCSRGGLRASSGLPLQRAYTCFTLWCVARRRDSSELTLRMVASLDALQMQSIMAHHSRPA